MRKTLIIAIALALVALLIASGSALAVPPISAVYTGTVTTTAGAKAPVGAVLTASIENYSSGSTTVEADGKYFLSVSPPDPADVGKASGFFEGKTIKFYIDVDGPTGYLPKVEATPAQAAVFREGSTNTGITLTYTPPATPTPTPTVPGGGDSGLPMMMLALVVAGVLAAGVGVLAVKRAKG